MKMAQIFFFIPLFFEYKSIRKVLFLQNGSVLLLHHVEVMCVDNQ